MKNRKRRTKININDKFGRLTILEFIGYQNNHRTYRTVPCCFDCNCSKTNRSIQDFINHSQRIVAHWSNNP